MPLTTEIVGTEIGERTAAITPRLVMAYAAGIGDHNPRYFDDTRAEPLAAPPLFGVVLDYPLQTQLNERTPLEPAEARRAVHASHDMTLHRLVRAGDVLTTRGRVIGAEERSAGAYLVTKYETIDAKGEPVLTVFYGRLFRGVGCAGEPRWLERLPEPPARAAGAPLSEQPDWTAAVPIAPGLPHVYSECADIYNPIHTERSVALAAGLPDIILHGTATLALAARAVVDRSCGGDPSRLRRIACRFAAMVIPGTTIRIAGTASDTAEGGRIVYLSVLNAAGQAALRDAFAVTRP